MNETVILTQLSSTIAGLTRCSEEDAENFLRELFLLAAERLEADGQVTVPGLGTFMITDDTVAFAPDPELAEAVNAPFAAFDAVELPDEDEEEAESAEFEQEEDAAEPTPDPDPQPCRDARPVRPPQSEPESQPAGESADESTPDSDAQTVRPYTEVPTPDRRRRGSVWPVIWWSVACVACFALGWFARGYEPVGIPKYVAETVPEPVETVAPEDTVVVVEEPAEVVEVAKPVAEPVTDTIRAGRFLTTMAREHYGRMEYWVYIYEANAAKLGHPDRLSAGTVVVIPSADSLGLRPDDAAKIADAERLAADIYGRFN